jgi:hypothetical protein
MQHLSMAEKHKEGGSHCLFIAAISPAAALNTLAWTIKTNPFDDITIIWRNLARRIRLVWIDL